MKSLLTMLFVSVLLAHLSQKNSNQYTNEKDRKKLDIYAIILIIVWTFYIGLRVSYNDTYAYIRGFRSASNLTMFLSNPENLDLLHNPLFYAFTSLFRMITDNYHLYLLFFAFLNSTLFIKFIKKHTANSSFAFAIFLFFAFDLFMFSMAAIKQVTAMAILTIALDALIEKKYFKYFFIVTFAGLVHTYAFGFYLLPLFNTDIWNYRMIILLLITLFVMNNFQSIITEALEVADTAGKTIASYEVFDGNQMNVLRVIVYMVIPLILFLFKGRLNKRLSREEKLFGNMCIISLMFILMASMNGANMFGRMATYFIIGAVVMFPNMINQLFNKLSANVVFTFAAVCFLGFFMYDNLGFYREAISILEFIGQAIGGVL